MADIHGSLPLSFVVSWRQVGSLGYLPQTGGATLPLSAQAFRCRLHEGCSSGGQSPAGGRSGKNKKSSPFSFFFKDTAWRLLLPTLSVTSYWPELSHKAKGILSGHLGNVVCIREAMSSAKA